MSLSKMGSNTDLENKNNPSAWSVFLSREGLIFQFAVVLTSAISVFVGIKNNSIPVEVRINTLTTGGSFSFLMWLALSYSIWLNTVNNFFKNFSYFFAIVGPIGILTILANHQMSEILFWWNLVVWSVVTIKLSLPKELFISNWERILLTFSMVWAVTSTMVTIGSWHWFPFSVKATQRLSGLVFFVDIRLLLGILFIIAATGTAIFHALIQERPILKEMDPWVLPIPDGKSFFLSLVPPIIHVINVLLVVFHAIVELLWKSIQLLVILFGRIGVHLAKLIKKIATQYTTWISTGRSLLTLLLIVISFYLIKITSPSFFFYLSTSIWKEQIIHLAPIIFNVFMILLCVWVITSMINQANIKSVGDAAIMSLGWLLMVYLLGGALVYGFYCLGLDITGYENIGIFSVILVLLIVLGIVYALYGMQKKNKEIEP